MHNKNANLIKTLSELVAFKTEGYNYEEKQSCIDYVENYLKKYNLHITRFEKNRFPSLVASTRPGKTPKVLLQAHLDVVPAKPVSFKLGESDDKLYGRGVYDMKFAAACYLQLIEELSDSLAALDFAVMFTTDEELGGKDGVGYLVEEGYRPDVCIIPDGGNDWQIESKCNDVWITEVETDGESAHGSRPWEGENAIYKLMTGLIEIQKVFGEQKPHKNSMTVSQIEGGYAENQVPDYAKATLDMRFVNHEQYITYHNVIKGILDEKNIRIKHSTVYDGTRVSLNHPEIVKFLDIAKSYLGKPLSSGQSLGSSDAHFLAEINVPTIVIRPEGGGAHSDLEWISTQGLYDFYEILKHYIIESGLESQEKYQLDNNSLPVPA